MNKNDIKKFDKKFNVLFSQYLIILSKIQIANSYEELYKIFKKDLNIEFNDVFNIGSYGNIFETENEEILKYFIKSYNLSIAKYQSNIMKDNIPKEKFDVYKLKIISALKNFLSIPTLVNQVQSKKLKQSSKTILAISLSNDPTSKFNSEIENIVQIETDDHYVIPCYGCSKRKFNNYFKHNFTYLHLCSHGNDDYIETMLSGTYEHEDIDNLYLNDNKITFEQLNSIIEDKVSAVFLNCCESNQLYNKSKCIIKFELITYDGILSDVNAYNNAEVFYTHLLIRKIAFDKSYSLLLDEKYILN